MREIYFWAPYWPGGFYEDSLLITELCNFFRKKKTWSAAMPQSPTCIKTWNSLLSALTVNPCVLLTTKNFDVLAINETRLDCTISDDLVSVPNYVIGLIRFDRNRNGGGVCIYINNTISYCNLSHKVPGNLEAVWIEVHKPYTKPFVVCSIYKPPNCSLEIFSRIGNLMSDIDSDHQEIYLLGDLNCDMLHSSSHVKKRLNVLMESYQLSQVTTQPTRVTHFSSTLIDACLTSNPENIILSDVIPLGISDHNLIHVVRKSNSVAKTHSHKSVRVISKISMQIVFKKIS
jgi:hypothetical protein